MQKRRTFPIQRTLEESIKTANQQFPVVVLTGPRQVGKTTLLQRLSLKKRTYVTLDDPMLASLAKSEPALFLERFPPPVFIDEIQYAPELFRFIKIQVDQNQKPGAFWLSGSQAFHLMKNASESLAGRAAVLNLLGLSEREIQGNPKEKPFLPDQGTFFKKKIQALSVKELYEKIWRGFYPGIALQPKKDKELFYRSYVQTYLQRDLRDLAHVGNEMTFLRFLKTCAARSGQLLHFSELARDVDISPHTAKHWLSLLETSGIIFLLHPYASQVTQRLIKMPKLYFLDTGLCSYLAEWPTPETLEAGAMSGAILETFVVGEILKSYLHQGKNPPLYYYRDKDQKEIDLLIQEGDNLYPIEIKKTSAPHLGMLKNFSSIESLKKKRGLGALICLVHQALPLNSETIAIPVQAI